MSNQAKIIFDSRQAGNVYTECENYFRGSTFQVLAGEAAVLEMTTHDNYRGCTTFYVIRIAPALVDPECKLPDNCIDKVYRCYTPNKDVIQGPPTSFTDDNRSILRLGWDRFNNTYNDFIHITRPGDYYIIADRCENPSLADCANPTVVDMTIVPYQLTGSVSC